MTADRNTGRASASGDAHAVICCDGTTRRGRRAGTSVVHADAVRVWRLRARALAVDGERLGDIVTAAQLAESLHVCRGDHGRLTVWLPRGWPDAVLSGVAELLDLGRWRYSFLALGASQTVAVAALDGRAADITSLAAWTGSVWDAWSAEGGQWLDRSEWGGGTARMTPGERTAVGSVGLILAGRALLRAGPGRLTAASQARQLWRTWLGPRVTVPVASRARDDDGAAAAERTVVLPLRTESRAARSAARHCCHGLQRWQYVRGHVDSPVVVCDLRSAYLAALLAARMPTAYAGGATGETPQRVYARLQDCVAAALCQLGTGDRAHVTRIHGRPVLARGRYWAWLCGAELETALQRGEVQAVERAWYWLGADMPRGVLDSARLATDWLTTPDGTPYRPLWRVLYATLVGGWAQWERDWIDRPAQHPPARWSAWTQTDLDTMTRQRWRCVGGRTQCQAEPREGRRAEPIMYATITAQLRHWIEQTIGRLPPDSVYAVAADALWVTPDAAEILTAGPWTVDRAMIQWAERARYDRAWLDGHGAAVVERDGVRHAIVPGVPSTPSAGPDGRVRWPHMAPWSSDRRPRRETGVRIGGVSYDAGRMVLQHSDPAMRVDPAIMLRTTILREELLLAPTPDQRR